MPVLWWPCGAQPGAGLPPVGPGARAWVLALAWPTALPRAAAREAVRRAARTFLARLWGVAFTEVNLETVPGQAPRVRGDDTVGLSFSHAPGLSLVAIHLDGPIGVDLQADEVPGDWRAVARDFLDPQATARLERAQGRGFASEWAAFEAGLKLRGLPLQERFVRTAREASDCGSDAGRAGGPLNLFPLDLPGGWVGWVAGPGLTG